MSEYKSQVWRVNVREQTLKQEPDTRLMEATWRARTVRAHPARRSGRQMRSAGCGE